MQTIAKDLRHENVVVLKSGDVEAAAFPDWSMAYVSATAEQVARWAGLPTTSRLPELWESIRQNPERATQVKKSILAVLLEDRAA